MSNTDRSRLEALANAVIAHSITEIADAAYTVPTIWGNDRVWLDGCFVRIDKLDAELCKLYNQQPNAGLYRKIRQLGREVQALAALKDALRPFANLGHAISSLDSPDTKMKGAVAKFGKDETVFCGQVIRAYTDDSKPDPENDRHHPITFGDLRKAMRLLGMENDLDAQQLSAGNDGDES